jgi:hypothetical protein
MGIEDARMLASAASSHRYSLLWRGSRDGFRARDFHRCCDGRSPTLTLVSDTDGNIFGGFTAAEWEGPLLATRKGDSSGRHLLFTVRNPHNLPAQVFPVKPDCQSSAITVSSHHGPCFGECDLLICDCCDANASHARGFGSSYENTTGVEGRAVFTGSDAFTVKEIEVFLYEPRAKNKVP